MPLIQMCLRRVPITRCQSTRVTLAVEWYDLFFFSMLTGFAIDARTLSQTAHLVVTGVYVSILRHHASIVPVKHCINMSELSYHSETIPLSVFIDFGISSTGYSRMNLSGLTSVWPQVSYKSSPWTSPYINVTHQENPISDGYLFIAPVENNLGNKYGPSGKGFIFDMKGDLIYAADDHTYEPCTAWVAGITDFRVQTYNNQSYLTYWNGCNTKSQHWGYRWGSVTFVDDEYQTFLLNPDLKIDTSDAATTGFIDMHDHQMTDRNTIVVTSYNNINLNDSSIADGLFFELDVATEEVLFEWHALDHLDMRKSHWNCNGAGACDWMHLNSVQAVGNNYLISARHLFAIYLVSGIDGTIIWKLDGLGNGTWDTTAFPFRWQHHARATNVTEYGMTISLFNNNNYVDGPQDPQTQSQGLAFWIPMPPDPAKPPVLVKQLQTPEEPIYSGTQGSYQFDVGNGNGFIGYGLVPKAREYGPEGDLRWQAQFGYVNEMMSYRAFKQSWHGTPRNWNPAVTVESLPGGASRAYVSWNGATDISGWAVYGGDSPEALRPIGVARKHGFETTFSLDKATCVRVGAIRNNAIIRMSNVACVEAQELRSTARQVTVLEWLSYAALFVLLLPLIYRAVLLFRDLKYRNQPMRSDDQIGLLSADEIAVNQGRISTDLT